eukprot:7907421-Pyramimonas_sp.AAC.1
MFKVCVSNSVARSQTVEGKPRRPTMAESSPRAVGNSRYGTPPHPTLFACDFLGHATVCWVFVFCGAPSPPRDGAARLLGGCLLAGELRQAPRSLGRSRCIARDVAKHWNLLGFCCPQFVHERFQWPVP